MSSSSECSLHLGPSIIHQKVIMISFDFISVWLLVEHLVETFVSVSALLPPFSFYVKGKRKFFLKPTPFRRSASQVSHHLLEGRTCENCDERVNLFIFYFSFPQKYFSPSLFPISIREESDSLYTGLIVLLLNVWHSSLSLRRSLSLSRIPIVRYGMTPFFGGSFETYIFQ